MDNLNLADIAAVTGGNNALGGNGGIWLLIILFFLIGMGGNGFGGRYGTGEFGTFATASSQNEILLGQKFDALGRQINTIGDGISSLGYSQLQQMNDIKTAVHAEGEATRAMIQQGKIESLEQRIQELSLQQNLAGVVRYPMASTWSAGNNPFCNCNCGF